MRNWTTDEVTLFIFMLRFKQVKRRIFYRKKLNTMTIYCKQI